jgi:hypothetical protein
MLKLTLIQKFEHCFLAEVVTIMHYDVVDADADGYCSTPGCDSNCHDDLPLPLTLYSCLFGLIWNCGK